MAPAVVVLAPGVLVIVSPGVSTATVLPQGAVVVPGGQVDPTAGEVTVVMTSLSPASGLRTVTEKVIVTESAGARSPVHDSTGLASETDPALAAASPS